jgi:hypothetical protein
MDGLDPFLNLSIFKKFRALDESSDTTRSTLSDNSKSYAQVETLVRPQVVSPKSGGLKPGRKRPYRLMGRFSKEERITVVGKAEAMCMSVNEYIRTTSLGANDGLALYPELRQRFLVVHKELCRQGKQLGRIADYLDANPLSPDEVNSLLGMIARSLMVAHMKVRKDLIAGRTDTYS